MNGVFIRLASEDHCNIKGDKDIVIGWTSTHRELVCDVLLCYEELDPCPRKTEDKASFFLDMIKFSMLCDDGISTLRAIET